LQAPLLGEPHPKAPRKAHELPARGRLSSIDLGVKRAAPLAHAQSSNDCEHYLASGVPIAIRRPAAVEGVAKAMKGLWN